MENKLYSVLFIDDDKCNNIFNTRIASKSKGLDNITSLTSAKEGLNYLQKARENKNLKPDLIFLDLNMPGMNGWEFIEEYEKIDVTFTCNIKIFLLTTSINPDDVERSKSIAVVSDFLNKPLTTDLLEKLIIKIG
jgi:CheY-like chemotaxis protein